MANLNQQNNNSKNTYLDDIPKDYIKPSGTIVNKMPDNSVIKENYQDFFNAMGKNMVVDEAKSIVKDHLRQEIDQMIITKHTKGIGNGKGITGKEEEKMIKKLNQVGRVFTTDEQSDIIKQIGKNNNNWGFAKFDQDKTVRHANKLI